MDQDPMSMWRQDVTTLDIEVETNTEVQVLILVKRQHITITSHKMFCLKYIH